MKASPLSPRNSPGFPSRKEGWIAGKGSMRLKEATVSIPGRQRRNKEGAMTQARPRHSGTIKFFQGYPRTPDPWCNFQPSLEYPQDNPPHFQIWNIFQTLQRCRIPKRMPREFTHEKEISSGTNF